MKHIHRKTLKLLRRWLPDKHMYILDLGEKNILGELIRDRLEHFVVNTNPKHDLNTKEGRGDVVKFLENVTPSLITAFEILEHLSNGNQLLRELPKATLLMASVPTKHPFGIHWDNKDPRNCHIFEPTPRQFNKYLTDAGYRIVRSAYVPVLSRRVYSWPYYAFKKRYYFVLAVKVKHHTEL